MMGAKAFARDKPASTSASRLSATVGGLANPARAAYSLADLCLASICSTQAETSGIGYVRQLG
jgi:hypothetical protein